MMWLLLVAVAIALVIRHRRRRPVVVLRSEPLSTLHGGLAKKQDAKKRAALDAASDVLR